MKSDFAAYVFYVNRPDLLCRALESFPQLWPELTIVDNSGGGSFFSLPNSETFNIFKPPVPLSYTQSMNWMLKNALDKGVDFIIHFHSDALSVNPNAVDELLAYVRDLRDTNRKWGCAWTFYDILWAINPKALQAIGGWDTVFSAYFCDNDVTRRLTLAGWECINTNIQGMSHEGSATVKSDPEKLFMNHLTFPMYRHYYVQKHGGEPGKELFLTPFNR